MIVVEPATMPFTKPLPSIVATAVLPVDHTPPAVILLAMIVEPAHKLDAAVIAVTIGLSFIVIIFETESIQPLPLLTIYLIVVIPAARAVTTPALSIVAAAVLLLLQEPPLVVLDKVVVLFTQTADEPLIPLNTGKAFTVIDVELALEQPVALITV